MKARRSVLGSVLWIAVACFPASARQPELRVLFIGNSYTYFNNLPHLVTALAESAHEERALDAKMIVAPGFTLKRHWDDGAAVAALQASSWDYVVLQEQSMFGLPALIVDGMPQLNPRLFHEYARRFDAAIRQCGAKTVFFLTWARRDLPETQDDLNQAYSRIAKELGARVAPVGMAWREALRERLGLVLHQSDQSHPAPAGSYLAACVLYATLYGRSPEGLTAHIPAAATGIPDRRLIEVPLQGPIPLNDVQVSEPGARALQRIAWRMVREASARERKRR